MERPRTLARALCPMRALAGWNWTAMRKVSSSTRPDPRSTNQSKSEPGVKKRTRPTLRGVEPVFLTGCQIKRAASQTRRNG